MFLPSPTPNGYRKSNQSLSTCALFQQLRLYFQNGNLNPESGIPKFRMLRLKNFEVLFQARRVSLIWFFLWISSEFQVQRSGFQALTSNPVSTVIPKCWGETFLWGNDSRVMSTVTEAWILTPPRAPWAVIPKPESQTCSLEFEVLFLISRVPD